MTLVYPVPMPEPVNFKRGSTFSFLFNVPGEFDPGYFIDWIITSQLRIRHNTEAKGLIADINTNWVESPYSNCLLLYHTQTDKWKLGPAELDVRFESLGGHVVHAKTIRFNIVNEVTQA